MGRHGARIRQLAQGRDGCVGKQGGYPGESTGAEYGWNGGHGAWEELDDDDRKQSGNGCESIGAVRGSIRNMDDS